MPKSAADHIQAANDVGDADQRNSEIPLRDIDTNAGSATTGFARRAAEK